MGENYDTEVLCKSFDAHTRRTRKHLSRENISSMTCADDSSGDKWIFLPVSEVALILFPYSHSGVTPTTEEKFSILSPAEGIHAAIRSVFSRTKSHLGLNLPYNLPCVIIPPKTFTLPKACDRLYLRKLSAVEDDGVCCTQVDDLDTTWIE